MPTDVGTQAPQRRGVLNGFTRDEALSLAAILLFTELLSVGWIASALGVNEGRATIAQALGLAVTDFFVLSAIPIPLFAAYDRWPLDTGHRTLALARRITAAGVIMIGYGYLSQWTLLASAPLLGIDLPALRAAIGRPSEQLTWALLSVIGASLAYLILRRLREARQLEVRNAELRAAAVEAKLSALAAELRPHFLFNAINSLAELVHHDPPRTEALLLHLSSLLKGTLAAGQMRTVPLTEELAHLDDYLALQQLRFGDRLHISRDIAPDTLRMAIPPMLLQPIVENAIVHGIEGRRGASQLRLAAARLAGQLVITVDDDGPGPHRSTRSGTGTGLRNVRSRLATLYGARATADLDERPGGGARVTIRLPVERT